MNALGLTLLGSIAHATMFALAGAIVYLLLRRVGPAVGALAAGSSLALMVIVSAIALGPWPHWYTIAAPPGGSLVRATTSNEAADAGVRRPDRVDAPGSQEDSTAIPQLSSQPRDLTAARSASSIDSLARELSHMITTLALAQPLARWWWPDFLAAGLIAGVAIGFIRLAVGLLAVERLRRRSRPLDEAALVDEVQLLRAELSCTQTVLLRESFELETPATLGWRRPIILLPADWRDWSHSELRAILAHELAHVTRGDFLTGLIAQFSVALHFYHPLAHWLARRLRLEQELAADAWGAAVSGGNTSYIMTLAQMALKREHSGLAGPASAFLPSRGTLLTRIEMLRNTHVFTTGALPASARAGTIASLALIGLAVAGLRGPAGSSQSFAEAIGAGAVQNAEAGASTRGNATPLDLALLPAETKLLLALRPATLLESREAKALVSELRLGRLGKSPQSFTPEEIDQLAIFWEGLPESPGPPGSPTFIPPPAGLMARLTKAQDWKTRLAGQFGPAEEFRVDGQTCFHLGQAPVPGWCAFISDDRTVVLAGENTIRDLIEDRKSPAPRRAWDEVWEKSSSAHVIAALDTRWLRRRFAQAAAPTGSGSPSPFGLKLDSITPLLEKARAYVISLDASPGMRLDVRGVTSSALDAKPVAETMQAVLTLARNSVEGLVRDSAGKPSGEPLKGPMTAVASLLSQARIEIAGNVVHLQASSPMQISEVVKSLAPAVMAARSTASRARSMNNLRQIGLAFHNYLDVNNRFPAPAELGGEQKKYPYSWRVALLPYLDQEPLYRQYHFDEPWDSPNNRKLIDQMPMVYSALGDDGTPSSKSNTSYFVFTGEATALGSPWVPGGKNTEARISQITDGLSNTILAVESRGDVAWTNPVDIPFDPNAASPMLGGFWPDGFNALICDGSVRAISNRVAPAVLKALVTRAGGEVIPADGLDPNPAPAHRPTE